MAKVTDGLDPTQNKQQMRKIYIKEEEEEERNEKSAPACRKQIRRGGAKL